MQYILILNLLGDINISISFNKFGHIGNYLTPRKAKVAFFFGRREYTATCLTHQNKNAASITS